MGRRKENRSFRPYVGDGYFPVAKKAQEHRFADKHFDVSKRGNRAFYIFVGFSTWLRSCVPTHCHSPPPPPSPPRPPRFLQVMRGEETNERKEGKERERERCVLCLCRRKGRGGTLTSAFPYYYFFRYAGNLSLPPLFPSLFPPPRLLHYFPCMDSFSSFPPLLSVVVFCLGLLFSFMARGGGGGGKKKRLPSLPFSSSFFSVLPHFDVSRFFFS